MDPKPHAAAAPPSEGSAYPRMSPEDLATPPPPVVAPAGSNPYVMPSPSSGPPAKSQSPSYRLASYSFTVALNWIWLASVLIGCGFWGD